jgi:hypothetical protein
MLRRVGAAAQPELNAVGDEAGLEDAAPGADRVVRARVQDVTISGNFSQLQLTPDKLTHWMHGCMYIFCLS